MKLASSGSADGMTIYTMTRNTKPLQDAEEEDVPGTVFIDRKYKKVGRNYSFFCPAEEEDEVRTIVSTNSTL